MVKRKPYNIKTIEPWPWSINLQKQFLYLDTGAWQGDEKGNFKSSFTLLSGEGVAVCNYYKVPKSWPSNIRCGDENKTSIWNNELVDILNDQVGSDCKHIWDFLLKMDSKTSPLNYIQYFYYSTSLDETIDFWDKDKLLVVIGDLHLHLFRQYDEKQESLVDNFIRKSGNKRLSLEKDFCKFLSAVHEYQKDNSDVTVKVVQAGDIIDIWEVEHMFSQIIERNQETKDPVYDDFLSFYVSEGVLQSKSNPKVNPKVLMDLIQKRVFPKIFDCINGLKNDFAIDVVILQGNHDDALKYSFEFNEGPEQLVHIEHGHRFDSANEPGGDWLGRFLTKKNVDFEQLGHGDWFKSLEKPAQSLKKWLIYIFTFGIHLPLDQRETYIKASRDVNSYFVNNKGKKLSTFIMAHTHIPHGQKISR